MTDLEQHELYNKCMICCYVFASRGHRNQLRRCDDCWTALEKVFVQHTPIPVEEWTRNGA